MKTHRLFLKMINYNNHQFSKIISNRHKVSKASYKIKNKKKLTNLEKITKIFYLQNIKTINLNKIIVIDQIYNNRKTDKDPLVK